MHMITCHLNVLKLSMNSCSFVSAMVGGKEQKINKG